MDPCTKKLSVCQPCSETQARLERELAEARRNEVATAVICERLNRDLAQVRADAERDADASASRIASLVRELEVSRAANEQLRDERERLMLRVPASPQETP